MYKEFYCPDHPKARPNGCILEHRHEAEKIIGRYLTDEEVVHHIDEIRSNNKHSNLMIFATQGDHARFHMTGICSERDGIFVSPEKIYTCVDCGVEIPTKNANRCIKCKDIFIRKVKRPSKEDLFELIKTFPFTKIGKMYSVSDNAIRKWCKSYDLPTRKKDIKLL